MRRCKADQDGGGDEARRSFFAEENVKPRLLDDFLTPAFSVHGRHFAATQTW